jgi:D-alanyl-D-alanine carboxypeptidase
MGLGCLAPPAYRLAVLGLLASFSVAAISCDYAEAKTARHSKQAKQGKQGKQVKHRVIHGPNYNPPYAAIVVDANSDRVLHEASPDEPRHPASLTKIMTLYLMFEQIEAGKFKLDTPLQVSAHAAAQTPTKLGLKANQTLTVEDAIKGLVTKSANDAAAVVGEAIGGTESDFARLMTEKARALGMVNTTYVNASGLPAAEQITTARDQALLGRAVQDRFPGFYRYFATPSFRYRGKEMRNHNGLLGNVKGVDGIKTGYTEASGYNLVSSVRREDRHIVAVVLGGKSNAKRDARMRELIEQHITLAAVRRTAPKIMEAADHNKAQQIGTQTDAPAENVKPASIPLPSPNLAPSGSVEPTSASERSEQSEAANSKSRKSKPPTQAAKPQTEVAKATAIAKLPTVRSRAAASRPASAKAKDATSISIVAPGPQSSW